MGIGEDINVNDVPLDKIDVSRPEIFLNDNWQPWFERLRKEAPVHYLADSVNGPFWSVTSHEMIKAVDTNNEIFSSEAKGIAIVDPYVAEEGQMQGKNFISMDGDEHVKQRMAVAPTVAPKNLAGFEPLIRERASDILDNLPIGETFNWVDEVSIELTARMLATLFDFPYEDRRKLVHWSDLATNVPEVTGDDSIDMKERYDELMGAAAAFYQLWMAKQGQPPSFDLISML
ncbi:MAG: cytochrome P450, partial [Pseudomonadales bacterium]|nr:cytochrome P450 [Pseudomonadales bacterium]